MGIQRAANRRAMKKFVSNSLKKVKTSKAELKRTLQSNDIKPTLKSMWWAMNELGKDE